MKTNLFILFVLIVFFIIFCVLWFQFLVIKFMILTIVFGVVIITGIFTVPNEPPSIGLITFFGNRIWSSSEEPIIVNEGINWIFLRKIVFDFTLIKIKLREYDFSEQELVFPDNGKAKARLSIAYKPDPNNIINYLNLGDNEEKRDEMVIKNIGDILEEKLRTWSRDDLTMTWEIAISSKDKAKIKIMNGLCGKDLTDPEMKALSSSKGKISIDQMGIILIKFNLAEMEPFGEVYEASVAKNTEDRQRTSETYDFGTDLEIAKILHADCPQLTLIECVEKVRGWKITREANKELSISAIAKVIFNQIK